jgi:hypothetical protein
VLVKGREMRGIKAKDCRGFRGRRGKDDRKQNMVASLAEGHKELKRSKGQVV